MDQTTHEGLSSPGNLDWTDNTEEFEFSRTIIFGCAGINLPFRSVLSEPHNMPAIECWVSSFRTVLNWNLLTPSTTHLATVLPRTYYRIPSPDLPD